MSSCEEVLSDLFRERRDTTSTPRIEETLQLTPRVLFCPFLFLQIIYLRATGGEVGSSAALAPKIGPLGLVSCPRRGEICAVSRERSVSS
jgi:hypothetical protein